MQFLSTELQTIYPPWNIHRQTAAWRASCASYHINVGLPTYKGDSDMWLAPTVRCSCLYEAIAVAAARKLTCSKLFSSTLRIHYHELSATMYEYKQAKIMRSTVVQSEKGSDNFVDRPTEWTALQSDCYWLILYYCLHIQAIKCFTTCFIQSGYMHKPLYVIQNIDLTLPIIMVFI